ncbi:HSPB1-associated protein 1 [Thrips palmi]|uniref:HSPB1-associated protein 1 n=1 Tax=Thrips palmi TaxID=161013 RepID=A0A6P8YW84_THRPL|nr:HSPB1-associated protein 1 [Thrips palmi]
MCEKNQEKLKDFILSLSKPVVFHGRIDDWEVLKWNIEDWSTAFGKKLLPFRCGVRSCSLQPLWERYCGREVMTLAEFASIQRNPKELKDSGKWFYFDYKYLNEWTPQDNNALKSVSWSSLGFPEMEVAGSTLWIGSGGAHTPCHYDTYGSNLVAQVFGTKRWILWPPSESKTMRPTRVPYEESSVYSKWNFNCPLPSEFYHDCKEIYIVDLKPGDVLFVPRHWWHYVECLDTSVSINSWMASNLDYVSRLDEALVKFTVSQVSKDLSLADINVIVNPNEDDVDSTPLSDSTNMITYCTDALKSKITERSKCSDMDASDPLPVVDRAEYVPCSTLEELRNLTNDKCNCNSKERHQRLMTESIMKAKDSGILHRRYETPLQKVINAFCHPEVIEKVREKLLDSLNVGLDELILMQESDVSK